MRNTQLVGFHTRKIRKKRELNVGLQQHGRQSHKSQLLDYLLYDGRREKKKKREKRR